MVNRQLRQALLANLGVSKQALSQRAKRLKETYGPMTTDEAVYVIAHMRGLDISRYVPLATVDRVRSLVPRALPALGFTSESPVSKKRPKTSSVKPYPLLSSKQASYSYALGQDVYPVLFQLENSIRALIERVLAKPSIDWWVEKAPPGVQSNVRSTMAKEKRYPYRDRRGNHPLYYANLDDLKKIIIDPVNEPEFQVVIIDIPWFKVKMEEVYMVRNNLAHCVPLSKDDITRILLFHRDWARIIETAGLT